MRPLTPTTPPRARAGFTIIELLITLVMFSVIGGAIVSVLNGQQRFGRAAAEIGATRMQMQTAQMVLPSELRMLSPTDRDILTIDATSILMQSTIATGVVCARAVNVLTIEPTGRLSSRLFMPVAGDSAFIWDDRGASAADDTWRSSAPGTPAHAVSAVAPAVCATPLTFGLATTATYAITIAGATPMHATVARGAPIRITRQVRYGLYQSAADNNWYLGYRDPTFAAYQYVAGPFRSNSNGGLRFAYFDNSDNEITAANYVSRRDSVARIEITTRVQSASQLSLGGSSRGQVFYDSLKVGVSLRNRVP
ncbi:MAG: prepilin-type N-terminal cleavage/methylation domain-containing protein [Gemmatimonadaceae bacterium]|nr:prepilin-type N-terminal cleavage/methylation domain-containing protein [Gemmatimonadaceae bacterium]